MKGEKNDGGFCFTVNKTWTPWSTLFSRLAGSVSDWVQNPPQKKKKNKSFSSYCRDGLRLWPYLHLYYRSRLHSPFHLSPHSRWHGCLQKTPECLTLSFKLFYVFIFCQVSRGIYHLPIKLVSLIIFLLTSSHSVCFAKFKTLETKVSQLQNTSFVSQPGFNLSALQTCS